MPAYVYGCGACGNFEAIGRREDDYAPCPVCHNPARRRPYSGIPNIAGETVARSIPDPAYRFEAEKREFNQSWGTAERTMELVRQNTHTDIEGRKHVNTKAMSESS